MLAREQDRSDIARRRAQWRRYQRRIDPTRLVFIGGALRALGHHDLSPSLPAVRRTSIGRLFADFVCANPMPALQA